VTEESYPLVVAALGGNALLRRGEPLEDEVQQRNACLAARAIAPLTSEHRLVVTHGNGPQVGLLALREQAYRAVRASTLDVLGAATEGMIGYLLEQELGRALAGYDVATLLTRVVVDANDRAFEHLTKPIGPVYEESVARGLANEHRWAIARDGAGWRRVVASPAPLRIIERRPIALLVEAGVVVVCAGGGGIPVVGGDGDGYIGVEAVVDKDRAAALLAAELGASALLLLTDVDAVYRDWGTPQAVALAVLDEGEVDDLHLPAGSMAPKVEAAAWFVRRTGGTAAIGAVGDAVDVLRGHAGTRIVGTSEHPR